MTEAPDSFSFDLAAQYGKDPILAKYKLLNSPEKITETRIWITNCLIAFYPFHSSVICDHISRLSAPEEKELNDLQVAQLYRTQLRYNIQHADEM